MRNMKTVPYDGIFTLSAPSPKWVWNAQGQPVEVPAGQPAFGYDRFTGEPLGQIIESVDATNVLLNSFAPATQTVSVSDATTYTLSVYGSGSAEITVGGSGTATDGSPLTFTATGTSVTVTVTGTLDVFQLETGSASTSPIETTSSAVIRAADVMNANTSFAEQYDPEQGWLFIDYEWQLGSGAGPSGHILALKDTGAIVSQNRTLIYSSGVIIASGSDSYNFSFNFEGRHKALLRWAAGVLTIFVDGNIAATANISFAPSLNSMGFFHQPGSGGAKSNGHLFDSRMGDTISDADAIARTTL